MKQFPERIPLPSNIQKTRAERRNELMRSASIGVAIRSTIILFELFGVWLFGSSALLLDAIASLVDVASSLLLIFFIRKAAKPPDKDHPFGHGRYEPLVGLQLSLMLIVIGCGMFVQQILALSSQPPGEVLDKRAWLLPFIAVVLLEICYRVVMKTAQKQNSPALAADAFHYRIDSITSLFAMVALAIGAFFPMWSSHIDHLGAILISVLMVVLGLYASRENFDQLMDKVPDKTFFDRVKAAAEKVKGVHGTEKIKIQLYGPDAHVDIDIEVEPDLSVELAHKISQKVRAEIQKDWPAVRDVTVHVEPYYPNDH